MADLKLALLVNAVSPAIGGVLVRGEKGTAKSTVVRGLAALLPPVPVVPGCPYSCDPAAPDPSCPAGPHPGGVAPELRPVTLAELPVGATEDRLTGSLDIERVLTAGTTAFQPGLLAAAHRGVLYVDEVNLLHDHLVDLLLDAAALGVNYVEREGVSVRHASRFLLVGTMNPEEGELRPQLLDRFGLTVQVTASADPAERAEVVRRRLAFEADPDGFARRFACDSQALVGQVTAARVRLPRVQLPDPALRQICAVCSAFGVDGMRADLVTARTAIALAAWNGRDVVTEEDIRVAARLALPHRRRRDPFDAPGLDEQALDDALRETSPEVSDSRGPGPGSPGRSGPGPADSHGPGPGNPRGPGPGDSRDPGPGDSRGPEDPDDHPDGPGGPGGPDGPDGPGGPGGASAPSATSATSPTEATQAPPVAPAAPFRARLLAVPG
ncbi:MAG: AAA family ATPase, partial [Actinobacteria bacterium]|nr:AAA family ATPase [Actinomycetota bacterium]